MPRSSRTLSRPGFVAQWDATSHSPGQQVDWDNVPDSFIEDGQKKIPAGTIVSKLDSGKVVPRAGRDVTANPAEAATGMILSTAVEGAVQDAKTGYGLYTGGPVYEDRLPDKDDENLDTYKSELDESGTGWRFESAVDDRGV